MNSKVGESVVGAPMEGSGVAGITEGSGAVEGPAAGCKDSGTEMGGLDGDTVGETFGDIVSGVSIGGIDASNVGDTVSGLAVGL